MTNFSIRLDGERAACHDQSKECDGWGEALLQAFLDARDILLAGQRRRGPGAQRSDDWDGQQRGAREGSRAADPSAKAVAIRGTAPAHVVGVDSRIASAV
jgi:hypothetical protein